MWVFCLCVVFILLFKWFAGVLGLLWGREVWV